MNLSIYGRGILPQQAAKNIAGGLNLYIKNKEDTNQPPTPRFGGVHKQQYKAPANTPKKQRSFFGNQDNVALFNNANLQELNQSRSQTPNVPKILLSQSKYTPLYRLDPALYPVLNAQYKQPKKLSVIGTSLNSRLNRFHTPNARFHTPNARFNNQQNLQQHQNDQSKISLGSDSEYSQENMMGPKYSKNIVPSKQYRISHYHYRNQKK
ncbi:hypothetical protein HYD_3340 [Candidatus Hydrogenosomobacter endosymbioticus]|uniref:Uncharacterized protein n=2 Tax=Candidatus Hydrogenosomobacter endosymbioticus TaxID=2558174 RepID=A0ABM7V8T2_9PROT|nr:hypothetical protein HYD_3340 [Candidatus Hydrogenosomobacter endosymbioticus]